VVWRVKLPDRAVTPEPRPRVRRREPITFPDDSEATSSRSGQIPANPVGCCGAVNCDRGFCSKPEIVPLTGAKVRGCLSPHPADPILLFSGSRGLPLSDRIALVDGKEHEDRCLRSVCPAAFRSNAAVKLLRFFRDSQPSP
jgi:hypothetical protein